MTWTYVKVDHPPGFEGPNSRFFRPVMSTFGDDSILLTGSKIFTGESDEISYMNEIFQYQVGTGWINLGQLGKAIYIRFALVLQLLVPGGFVAGSWRVPSGFLMGFQLLPY